MNGRPSLTPSALLVFTAEERPDLWIRAKALSEVWPEYNNHGNHTGTYFGSLIPAYAHLQVVIYEPNDDEVVARGRSIPFQWDGTLDDLPTGIDAAGLLLWRVKADPTRFQPSLQRSRTGSEDRESAISLLRHSPPLLAATDSALWWHRSGPVGKTATP